MKNDLMRYLLGGRALFHRPGTIFLIPRVKWGMESVLLLGEGLGFVKIRAGYAASVPTYCLKFPLSLVQDAQHCISWGPMMSPHYCVVGLKFASPVLCLGSWIYFWRAFTQYSREWDWNKSLFIWTTKLCCCYFVMISMNTGNDLLYRYF